jgi:molybdate transport system substrate-binding protein
MIVSRRALLVLAGLLGLATAAPAASQGGDVVVFAAASLKTALDDINSHFPHETGKVLISYAASPALARQIEQGAPTDLFISADSDWMDYLQQRNFIKTETRTNLLGNRIVLIAPRDSTASATIAPGFNLAGLLGTGRLAMADVNAVPAGKYGKAALEALGVWPSMQNRIAQSENVRAALLFVSRGEAPLGIVYRTDAAADPNVKILDTFPESTHPAIIYPVALTARARHAQATRFLDYLLSPAAQAVFKKQGFTILAGIRPGRT